MAIYLPKNPNAFFIWILNKSQTTRHPQGCFYVPPKNSCPKSVIFPVLDCAFRSMIILYKCICIDILIEGKGIFISYTEWCKYIHLFQISQDGDWYLYLAVLMYPKMDKATFGQNPQSYWRWYTNNRPDSQLSSLVDCCRKHHLLKNSSRKDRSDFLWYFEYNFLP